MAYEYERAFGFGDNGDPMTPAANSVMPQTIIAGERLDVETAGASPQLSPVAAAGILGILGGVVLFALAIPFGVGAIAGAVAAPEGRKKTAAKWGALAGGLGGMAAYPIVFGVTGSRPVARSMSSLAPIALGAYMGVRERENVR
jgi:hypothetical protein